MSKLNKISLITLLFGGCFYWLSFSWLDQPIASIFHHLVYNPKLYTFYEIITLLGDPKVSIAFIGISSIISIAVMLKQPQNRIANFFLVTCIAMVVAIFAETTLKYLLGRYRPELLFSQGLYGFHYLSHQFLMNSTPSGHATRVFVLVTGLSLTWKRLSPLFILLGLLVCLSRLTLEFHYLSDVFFGALLGTFTTLWVARIYFSMTLSHQSYASLRLR